MIRLERRDRWKGEPEWWRGVEVPMGLWEPRDRGPIQLMALFQTVKGSRLWPVVGMRMRCGFWGKRNEG
jgi:hypothetical protein